MTFELPIHGFKKNAFHTSVLTSLTTPGKILTKSHNTLLLLAFQPHRLHTYAQIAVTSHRDQGIVDINLGHSKLTLIARWRLARFTRRQRHALRLSSSSTPPPVSGPAHGLPTPRVHTRAHASHARSTLFPFVFPCWKTFRNLFCSA